MVSSKSEQKQVNLRFHSCKVEFVRTFFGGNIGLKKSFWLFLTFLIHSKGWAESAPLSSKSVNWSVKHCEVNGHLVTPAHCRPPCGHVVVGRTRPHQVLASTLTLSQQGGGADYVHPILVSTSSFESHRRACDAIWILKWKTLTPQFF